MLHHDYDEEKFIHPPLKAQVNKLKVPSASTFFTVIKVSVVTLFLATKLLKL
jgi:hypothetical protein